MPQSVARGASSTTTTTRRRLFYPHASIASYHLSYRYCPIPYRERNGTNSQIRKIAEEENVFEISNLFVFFFACFVYALRGLWHQVNVADCLPLFPVVVPLLFLSLSLSLALLLVVVAVLPLVFICRNFTIFSLTCAKWPISCGKSGGKGIEENAEKLKLSRQGYAGTWHVHMAAIFGQPKRIYQFYCGKRKTKKNKSGAATCAASPPPAPLRSKLYFFSLAAPPLRTPLPALHALILCAKRWLQKKKKLDIIAANWVLCASLSRCCRCVPHTRTHTPTPTPTLPQGQLRLANYPWTRHKSIKQRVASNWNWNWNRNWSGESSGIWGA